MQLKYTSDVHPVITSIMNFHVYLWTARLVYHPKLIDDYDELNIVKEHVPMKSKYREKLLKGRITKEQLMDREPHAKSVRWDVYVDGWRYSVSELGYEGKDDYRRYILDKSDGIIETGQLLLNQSIEVYVYAVLGNQADTRGSIVATDSRRLETQVDFREKVRDAVINDDTKTNY